MQHTGRSMRIVSLVIAMFVCETMFCSRIFVLLMFQPFAQHRLCSLRSFCAVPTRRDPWHLSQGPSRQSFQSVREQPLNLGNINGWTSVV
jgi:hypothetical protein